MNLTFAKNTLRTAVLLAVAAVALGLSGCGVEHRKVMTNVTQDDLSAGNEPYFNVGPVTYQVQVSRQLNPFDSYDAQYLAGLQGAQNINPQQFWFGVFLWAKNQSGTTVTTADKFKLTDSDGQVFTPTALNANINPYAWTPEKLSPNDTEPEVGTAGANTSIGGDLVLFKLTQSVYSNRPLTLLVYAPGASKPSQVSLDL